MSPIKSPPVLGTLAVGAVGGIAGGTMEIAWIGLYGAATGTSTEPVARGIVMSVRPALATAFWSPSLGILIHMGLAIALGIGLALLLRLAMHQARASQSFALVMLSLGSVWAINFFVALPHINPAFAHSLPYAVTLFSKLLFGAAAAAVFHADRMRQRRARL
jgi:hypothetical protein